MTVLVGYATAHGSTATIANEMGEALRSAGLSVDVRSLDTVSSAGNYDAFVLGSAVHSGHWLTPAVDFVRRNAAGLGARPIWLFSVSSVGETSGVFGPRVLRWIRRSRHDSAELTMLRALVRPRDHRHFAGAVARSHWGLTGRLFMTVMGGRYGDHHDARDIAAWADGIAQVLSPRPAA